MTTPPIRSRRGKTFLNEEDVALCISWMTISQDPVIGIGQPMLFKIYNLIFIMLFIHFYIF